MADMRKCIGSTKFGIVAHEAPIGDFPAQPSQKGGLGRMCKVHWNQYTTALRKAALARQTADGGVATQVAPTVSDRAAVKGVKTAIGNSAKPAKKPQSIRTKPTRGRKTENDPIVEVIDAAIVEEASIA